MTRAETTIGPETLRVIGDRLAETAQRELQTSGEEHRTGPLALGMLADAMRAGGLGLAGVDLLAVYPPEALLPDRRAPALEFALTALRIIRDVLIFVPVFLTWLKLQEALTAYGKAKSTESFLLGWQAGTFDGGHTTFTPLSDAAMTVALLVLLVMLVAATVHVCEGYLTAATSNERTRGQLAQDLALATLLIPPTPEDARISIRQVAGLLPALKAGTAELAGSIDRMSDEIRAALEGGPGQRIAEALDTWVEKSAAMEHALNAIQIPATTLNEFKELHEQIKDDQRRLQSELNRLVDRIHSVAQNDQDMLEGLAGSLQRFNAGVQDLSEATAHLRDFVDTTRQFVMQIRGGNGRAEW